MQELRNPTFHATTKGWAMELMLMPVLPCIGLPFRGMDVPTFLGDIGGTLLGGGHGSIEQGHGCIGELSCAPIDLIPWR